MNKNNKILIGVLVVLAIIFFVNSYLKKSREESAVAFPKIAIDSAKITKIEITPASSTGTTMLSLTRSDSTVTVQPDKTDSTEVVQTPTTKVVAVWTVAQSDTTFVAKEAKMNTVVDNISKLKISRKVTTSKEKWADYELDEGKYTTVVISEGDAKSMTLYIGRYGNGSTFVRLEGDDTIYAVSGYLPTTFNSSQSSY